MAKTVPAQARDQLAHSPLALVVCQVRFATNVPAVTGEHVAAISKLLQRAGYVYPRAEPHQTVTLRIGPMGSPEQTESGGWRLHSDDRAWTVVVTTDNLALETTRYGSWTADFQPRLHALIEAVTATLAPNAELRFGLRYIDLFNNPVCHLPGDWKGRIADWLLHPALEQPLGTPSTSFQQQVTYALPDGEQVLLRYGTQPDASRAGALTFMLDTDIFREQLRSFDAADIQRAAERSHDVAHRMFRSMITDAFYSELKG